MTQASIAAVALFVALAGSTSLGQGAAQPSQPVDPTAQTPTNTAPDARATGSAGTSSPTQSGSGMTSGAAHADSRVFLGTVVHVKQGYVLKTGTMEYKLQDQEKAKEFDGKQVKLMGQLDGKKKTIHVQSIEASPAL